MNFRYPPRGTYPRAMVEHFFVCRHQVEIEVYPAAAEVYFRDEAYTDPVNTMFRFHAAVYNAPSSRVTWQVMAPNGGPGAGSIDATGLYSAPPKGTLPSGTTDLILATAADDPLRKAYAQITLAGNGTAPDAPAKVEIFPKQVYLYYPQDESSASQDRNHFIDVSNKMQYFWAVTYHTSQADIDWYVGSGGVYPSNPEAQARGFLYQLSQHGLNTGPDGKVVMVKAQLSGQSEVFDEARIILINYRWPGQLNISGV